MDKTFWLQKWEKNEIAFHESEANPTLVKHFNKLLMKKDARVFVPLCGKTLDIAWLVSHGYHVAGAELSELAIKQLFANLDVTPKISKLGDIFCYSAEQIEIFVGNIFDLTPDLLGRVDAIYDRAALVALPKEMRHQYTKHLMQLTDHAPQLLITYAYDQNQMSGPPFSVTNDEVALHYGDCYNVTLLANTAISGGLKGCPAKENVWLMGKK